MQKYFKIGVIVGAHGLKGEIKVYPSTNDPRRFEKLKYVFISQENDLKKDFHEDDALKVKIINVRIYNNMAFILIEGINTRDKAEKLKGQMIVIHRKNAVKLMPMHVIQMFSCSILQDHPSQHMKLRNHIKNR